jgi:hypothetical protein
MSRQARDNPAFASQPSTFSHVRRLRAEGICRYRSRRPPKTTPVKSKFRPCRDTAAITIYPDVVWLATRGILARSARMPQPPV